MTHSSSKNSIKNTEMWCPSQRQWVIKWVVGARSGPLLLVCVCVCVCLCVWCQVLNLGPCTGKAGTQPLGCIPDYIPSRQFGKLPKYFLCWDLGITVKHCSVGLALTGIAQGRDCVHSHTKTASALLSFSLECTTALHRCHTKSSKVKDWTQKKQIGDSVPLKSVKVFAKIQISSRTFCPIRKAYITKLLCFERQVFFIKFYLVLRCVYINTHNPRTQKVLRPQSFRPAPSSSYPEPWNISPVGLVAIELPDRPHP